MEVINLSLGSNRSQEYSSEAVGAIEDAIREAAEAGSGTIIRGGVARGAPADDSSLEALPEFWRAMVQRRRDIWQNAKLDDLLDGRSRMEFMLRFVLGHPDLHTTIVGTSNPGHLAANVEVAQKGPLSGDLRAEAQKRIRAATE